MSNKFSEWMGKALEWNGKNEKKKRTNGFPAVGNHWMPYWQPL